MKLFYNRILKIKLSIYFTSLVLVLCPLANIHAQIVFNSGNSAYNAVFANDFSPVIIADGSMIYEWNEDNNLYMCGKYVLIPDLSEIPNGNYTDTLNFYGFGQNGSASDTLFQWDNQKLLPFDSEFEQTKLFVSPLSQESMHYGNAINYNSNNCYYGDCPIELSGSEESLAYPNHSPKLGVFDAWTGQELIDVGNLKESAFFQKVAQQQLGESENQSYCVKTYGYGWRLPTDMEVGHFNDEEHLDNGFDIAYSGNEACYLWTSSLFKVYDVKRWTVHNVTGDWENCAGFLYTYSNRVRCVYSPKSMQNVSNTNIRQKNIKVSPNPTSNFIKITNFENKELVIKIIDINSTIILAKTINTDCKIDLSTLVIGVYVLQVFDIGNNLLETHKIVIQ
ncbi:MAG: T9SS type A sorting domain-containing protein [Bacteroidales bacterium]|nr:T9SS type A sorting domain-containing protein [Bacteroidales bacterium]